MGCHWNYTNSIEDSFEAQRHFYFGMTRKCCYSEENTRRRNRDSICSKKEDRFAMAKLVLVILKDMELPFVAEIGEEKKTSPRSWLKRC